MHHTLICNNSSDTQLCTWQHKSCLALHDHTHSSFAYTLGSSVQTTPLLLNTVWPYTLQIWEYKIYFISTLTLKQQMISLDASWKGGPSLEAYVPTLPLPCSLLIHSLTPDKGENRVFIFLTTKPLIKVMQG